MRCGRIFERTRTLKEFSMLQVRYDAQADQWIVATVRGEIRYDEKHAAELAADQEAMRSGLDVTPTVGG